ncbi:arylsulfatase [Flavivirga aquimarina]|uniref:Arylsulfatase n=1 Tax=Flavivirga aquimarina TaxID=2027862 RepID=A0ABT8W6R4_9FLAO|nr:arylsulfatase [Flavivirga aquimarina]MDO5968757.1 arylsulfatase [Flavivirga aquimarina]
MRNNSKFLGLLLLACLFSCTEKQKKQELTKPVKPNVIFIYADDMGYGEVQALNPQRGLIPTPNINQLAKEGMVFTDAHTSSSVCTPSRYALLTGRYNWRTRLQSSVLTGGKDPLITEDRMTLGHLFRDQGYSTSLIGKWHLGYHYNIPEVADEPKENTETHMYSKAPIGTNIPNGPITRGFDSFYGFHHSGSMSSIVEDDRIVKEIPFVDVLPTLTQEVVRQIDVKAEEAKNGKPFFIYFPQNSPHSPVAPAPEWQGKGGLGEFSDFVAQTDGSVGEVMKALERNGLTDNTIVIFSADNGTHQLAKLKLLEKQGHFSSANFRGHKADLWDGGHRVPFIWRWPGVIKAGTQSDQLICLTDVMATFAAYFSVDFNDKTAEDSYTFLPAIQGSVIDEPRSDVIHHSINGRFAIRQNEWKLLLAPGSAGRSFPVGPEAIAEGLPEMQLYNMKEDAGEQNNVINEHPEKVEAMIKLLESYVAKGRSTPGINQENDVAVDIYKTNLNSTHNNPEGVQKYRRLEAEIYE